MVLLLVAGCWSTDEVASEPAKRQQQASETGEVLFVSPTGRDNWPGTKKRPWRTLAHGFETILAGQRLYVRGGVYREQLIKLAVHPGAPRRRVEVLAYPGERPVVRGLVWLRDLAHWTVDGINVTWDPRLPDPPEHMVKLTGGVGWVWRNSEMWGARATANVLIIGSRRGRPADWSFTGNCVHGLRTPPDVKRGSNLAIGDMTRAGPGRVTRNLLFDAPGGRNMALGAGPRPGTRGASGPTGVTVSYNTVYGAAVSMALAGSTSNVVIERNLLGGTSSGTVLRARRLRGKHNLVRDNLGIQSKRFTLRRMGTLQLGPGNIRSDTLALSKVASCEGFRPTTAVSAYGRRAVG